MEGCLQEGALGWDPTRRHLPQAVSGQQQSRCLPQLHTAPGSRHHTTVDLPAGTAPAAPIGRSSPFPENGSCGGSACWEEQREVLQAHPLPPLRPPRGHRGRNTQSNLISKVTLSESYSGMFPSHEAILKVH